MEWHEQIKFANLEYATCQIGVDNIEYATSQNRIWKMSI